MICPVHNQDMTVVEHNKVELDYCTRCHGAWSDGGEALEVVKRPAGSLPQKHDAREQVIAFLGETLQGDE
ncbi:MAG: zf-TFIIB domain-containing protein [Chloroflexota bacterium]